MMKELTTGQRITLSIIRAKGPIEAYWLSAKRGIGERQIRAEIKALRRKGHVILPTSEGYALSRSPRKIFNRAIQLEHQARSMLKTASDLRRRARGMTSLKLKRSR